VLIASPTGWLSRRYLVTDGQRSVGEVTFGAWRTQGGILCEGRRLSIRRQGFWCSKYRLEEKGVLVAAALGRGAFRTGMYLARGDEEYDLAPRSWFSRDWELSQRSRSHGLIAPQGVFSRRANLALDEELPLDLRLFAFWLVALAWHRSAAATAAAAS